MPKTFFIDCNFARARASALHLAFSTLLTAICATRVFLLMLGVGMVLGRFVTLAVFKLTSAAPV